MTTNHPQTRDDILNDIMNAMVGIAGNLAGLAEQVDNPSQPTLTHAVPASLRFLAESLYGLSARLVDLPEDDAGTANGRAKA